ncbi:MAG: lysoplasmalogenase [Deltaproteobacteria bacterium]|nr:lysoplasmalogenase [Deltaproteobacteria bacterium]
MENTRILVPATILLSALLFFEKKDSVPGKLLTKTPLSLLFILAATLQNHPVPAYYNFLLIGLILCLGGDVLLIFPQKKAFLLGLVTFLLGHVFYVIAFFKVSQISSPALIVTLLILIFSIGVFFRLRAHLGSMLVPVILYIVVITSMVIGAGSVLFDSMLPCNGRYIVFAGALLFYFSDLFVARNRFVEKAFFNRLLGLPLYYSGQFLLAFSVGMMG